MTFEIFRGLTLRGYRWFWRLRGKNHRIVAIGGESFHNRKDIYDIIDKMINELQAAEIKVL